MHKWKIIFLLLPFWLIFYVAIPPFQSPDEQGHYNFVQSLSNLSYPSFPKAGKLCDSSEVRDVTNYYEGNKLPFNENKIISKPNAIPNRNYAEKINCTVQANQPPLYYLASTVFYKTATFFNFFGATRFYFTRLSSLFFYIIFIIFSYKSFLLLFNKKTSFFLSVAVGIQPTILMLAVGLNPEIGAVSLSTVVFYFILKYLKTGKLNYKNLFLLVLISAAAILSKITSLVVIPTCLFLIIRSKNLNLTDMLKKMVIYLFFTFLFITPWLLANWKVNSSIMLDNLALVYPKTLTAPLPTKVVVKGVLKDFENAMRTIPGMIGWLDTPLFESLAILELIAAFFAFTMGLFATLKERFGTFTEKALLTSVLFVTAVFTFNLYLAINFQLRIGVSGLQGRYFIIGVVPFFIVAVYGLTKFFRVSDQTISKLIVNISFFIYFIFVLFNFLPRYYV